MIVIPSAKNPSKSSNLVIFGPWDIHWNMESCFQRFGWVFKATRGVKTELVPKKSYFCWNHKVKSAISSTAIKHPKAPKFLNILAIFQNNLVKRMGKALVPAVPRLFSHLGHPSLSCCSCQDLGCSHGTKKRGVHLWTGKVRSQGPQLVSSSRNGKIDRKMSNGFNPYLKRDLCVF